MSPKPALATHGSAPASRSRHPPRASRHPRHRIQLPAASSTRSVRVAPPPQRKSPLNLLSPRRTYIFKLAYDEEYAKWSAGTVLTAHLMRHSLEQDRVIEIDYLTGDDAYKKSWMTARRERVGLIAGNPRSARGLLIGAREFAGESDGARGARPRASGPSAYIARTSPDKSPSSASSCRLHSSAPRGCR